MRMHAIVVIEPMRDLGDDRSGIGSLADAGIIALEGFNEDFCHAVALWALDWRGERNEADFAREATGIVSGVATAVIGQPFDGMRRVVYLTEAMLDSGDHEVANIRQ
jgi:hypothetical protein